MALTIPQDATDGTSSTARSTSGWRSSESVAPSIKGLAVFVYPAGSAIPGTPALVGDLVIGAAGSLCSIDSNGNRVCNISFTAPVGNDTVTLKLYDQEPSGGAIPSSANIVATGNSAITITANGSNVATLTLNSVTATVGSSGGTVGTIDPSDNGSISGGIVIFNLLPGAVPGGQQVTASVSEVSDLSGLPSLGMQRRAQFVQGAGNTLVYAFGFTLSPALNLSLSVTLNGTTFNVTGGTLLSALTAAPTGTLILRYTARPATRTSAR